MAVRLQTHSISFFTSTAHRAMLPGHTGWIQGLIPHLCFRIQTPISPPKANGRNGLRMPSPVPALPFVKNFSVCPASMQLFRVGKAVYFPSSFVNRSSRNSDNSMKLQAACPSGTSMWCIFMCRKICRWNLNKQEFLILIQNGYECCPPPSVPGQCGSCANIFLGY